MCAWFIFRLALSPQEVTSVLGCREHGAALDGYGIECAILRSYKMHHKWPIVLRVLTCNIQRSGTPHTSQHALLASTGSGQRARPHERDGRKRSTGIGGERHLDVPDARQYDRATDHVVREEGFRRGRQHPREHDGFVQARLLRTRRFEQPVQPRRIA